MSPIAVWVGTLRRMYPDSSKNEQAISQVELKLTKRGLEIVKLDMRESYYTFEMCVKAASAWIQNNPNDPMQAIKIVNDTLTNYKNKMEKKGDSFIISMTDYR